MGVKWRWDARGARPGGRERVVAIREPKADGTSSPKSRTRGRGFGRKRAPPEHQSEPPKGLAQKKKKESGISAKKKDLFSRQYLAVILSYTKSITVTIV